MPAADTDPPAARPIPDPVATLAQMQDARLLRALAWWQQKRAGRRLPDRTDLDPLQIPDLLPHVVLWQREIDAAGGTLDYRCRLAGTLMVQIHGYEFTGQTMAAFHGAKNAEIQPEYDAVAATGQPHYVERTLFWLNKDYQRYRRILLPFAWKVQTGEPEQVALILNVSNFL